MEVLYYTASMTFLFSMCAYSAFLWAKKKGYTGGLIVPARKSETGALLLGGSVIYVSVLLGMTILVLANKMSYYHIVSFGVTGAILAGLGYLDDKKELRPFAKLGGQFIASYIFANFCAFNLKEEQSLVFFNAFFFCGFAAFNGSNLLDGIDTISPKTVLVSCLSYFILGSMLDLWSLKAISILMAAPMVAFWWFNRAPSKIHLGEIGGGIIGLSMMFLCFVTYSSLTFMYPEMNPWQLIHVSAFGLLLPITELAVSFLRRLMVGRSPFTGDRLHMHHLLGDRYGLSATNSATVIASFHLIIQLAMVWTASKGYPIVSFWSGALCYVAFNFSIGYRYWNRTNSSTVPFTYIMDAISQKDVMIIPADFMDDIAFEMEFGEEEDPAKKDAA